MSFVSNLEVEFTVDKKGIIIYDILGIYSSEQQLHYWDFFNTKNISGQKAKFEEFIKSKNPETSIELNTEDDITYDIYFKLDEDEIIGRARNISHYKSQTVEKEVAVAAPEVEISTDLQTILHNARELIAIHDLDGTYKYVSGSAKKLTGFDPQELIGKSPYEFIHKDDLEPIFDEPIVSKLKKEPISNEEFRIIKKDGSETWFESYTKPVFDKNDNLVAFQSSSREITQRKKNEERYKTVNERLSQYREGLKLLSEITANADLSVEMQITEALGVTTEFFGMTTGVLSTIEDDVYKIENIYTTTDLKVGQEFKLGETYAEIVYRKNELVSVEHMSKSRYRTHPCFEIFKLESYIGIPYFVSGKLRGTIDFYSANPRAEAFDSNEMEFLKLLTRWISFLLQQHEYEKNLIADKIMLQAFVSSAPAAIAMFDTDFQYLAASDRWYSDYDLEDEFIIGRSHFEVFPDNGQDWEKIFRNAIKGTVERNDEDLLEKNDGEIKWIKWEVRPWYRKLDTVGGLIMHTEDITYQKEQQLQLKIAKRKAEQASKAKEQFLSTMSHEIRTPLNAILGMTDIMLMDETEVEKIKHLKLLQFSGKNLLALINDILDFNKIEAGKLELEEIDFNLKELLESIRASLDTLASKKGIEFQLKYDENLPKYFKGDSVRLNQVITNLSNNAIKFTDEGYVALKVRLLNQGDESCRIKFEVKDTGIGIPQTKIEKIFRSFEQASSDTHRKYGGSGLGLSITKKILEVMGTTIHVNSSEGLGSVFSFELELPIGINTDEVPELAAGEDQFDPDLKLLVAEDNPGNRTLIESLFKRWNLSWDFAFDGKVAVEKIKSKKYHIVLMDLQMPELDGYGATREIRKMDDEYFKNIPVVALTASVMSNVLEKTKKAGMNSYISKPFDPKNLKNTVIKYSRFFKQTYGEYINTDIDENEISQPDAGNKEFDIMLKDLPANEEKNNNQSDKFDFPYIKELVGDDEESITEIVVSSLESVIGAKNGIKEGINSNDITKVRSELHILRPNLHNIELGFLVDDLPKITELSDETEEILRNLLSGIEKEIETEKFKPFTK